MKRIEKFKKLLEVQESLGGTVDLVSPTRELVREGKIVKISARSGDHQDRYLFLVRLYLFFPDWRATLSYWYSRAEAFALETRNIGFESRYLQHWPLSAYEAPVLEKKAFYKLDKHSLAQINYISLSLTITFNLDAYPRIFCKFWRLQKRAYLGTEMTTAKRVH